MVTAGEDAYDVIITSLNDGIGKMGANGLLADMASIDAIDFDMWAAVALAKAQMPFQGNLIIHIMLLKELLYLHKGIAIASSEAARPHA